MLDRELFLKNIPQDGTIGNGKLQSTLGWDDEKYQAIRDELINEGRIITGRGRGGSLRFVSEEANESQDPAIQEPVTQESPQEITPEHEEAFLAILSDTKAILNRIAQETLGYSDSLYQAVKAKLLQDGKIIPGRGPGGSVRRRQEGEAAYAPPAPKEEKVRLDLSQFESDEDAFMSQIPEREEIHHKTLISILGFEPEKFREVKYNLLVNGSIVPGAGRGTIRRRRGSEEFWEDNTPEPRKKASEEYDEEGIPREIPDPVIFSCSEESNAQKILDALHLKYKRSIFYTAANGQSIEIKLKLNKYAGLTVPLRSEKLGEVIEIAQDAFNALSACHAPEAPAEEQEKAAEA